METRKSLSADKEVHFTEKPQTGLLKSKMPIKLLNRQQQAGLFTESIITTKPQLDKVKELLEQDEEVLAIQPTQSLNKKFYKRYYAQHDFYIVKVTGEAQKVFPKCELDRLDEFMYTNMDKETINKTLSVINSNIELSLMWENSKDMEDFTNKLKKYINTNNIDEEGYIKYDIKMREFQRNMYTKNSKGACGKVEIYGDTLYTLVLQVIQLNYYITHNIEPEPHDDIKYLLHREPTDGLIYNY